MAFNPFINSRIGERFEGQHTNCLGFNWRMKPDVFTVCTVLVRRSSKSRSIGMGDRSRGRYSEIAAKRSAAKTTKEQKMTNKLKLASLALVVVIAGSVGFAHSFQSANSAGSISGTVTDPSGAVVPGATVTISSDHFAETVSTDDIGRYSASTLVPEHYTVRIRANGFSTFEKTGLIVSPGHETEADGPLSISKVYQQITVTDRDTESQRSAN